MSGTSQSYKAQGSAAGPSAPSSSPPHGHSRLPSRAGRALPAPPLRSRSPVRLGEDNSLSMKESAQRPRTASPQPQDLLNPAVSTQPGAAAVAPPRRAVEAQRGPQEPPGTSGRTYLIASPRCLLRTLSWLCSLLGESLSSGQPEGNPLISDDVRLLAVRAFGLQL